MTWGFGYLVSFLVGLVLAAVTGLLRDLRAFAQHTAVVPHPDLHSPVLGVVARCASPGLVLSGVVGLVLSASRGVAPTTALLWACGAGVLAVLAATVLLRPRLAAPAPDGRHATVVKEIQPGGYGQVRLERNGVAVLLAAQSTEGVPLPAGALVEVVDATRSVLTVRLARPA